ncbi:MAG: hypothetical protein H6718_07035 [Polyangiaceae bacterium]|nr:hypothetical protein [Polyangiaceae bacterium]
MARLRGRVLWAYRAFLMERGYLESVLTRLSDRNRTLLASDDLPSWVDVESFNEAIAAVFDVGGMRLVRDLGAYIADLLVDTRQEPDMEQALERCAKLVSELTSGFQVHFEPLRRVAGRIYIRSVAARQSELAAEAWGAAIERVLQRNCQRAWTLTEDLFEDRGGSTLSVLCDWKRATAAAPDSQRIFAA